MRKPPCPPKNLKTKTEYVFIAHNAVPRIIEIVNRKKQYFVRMTKTDAINSINGLENVINPYNAPLIGHFEWPYILFKDLIEKEWDFMGEL